MPYGNGQSKSPLIITKPHKKNPVHVKSLATISKDIATKVKEHGKGKPRSKFRSNSRRRRRFISKISKTLYSRACQLTWSSSTLVSVNHNYNRDPTFNLWRAKRKEKLHAKIVTETGAKIRLMVYSNARHLFWKQRIFSRRGRAWTRWVKINVAQIDQYLDVCLVKWTSSRGNPLWGVSNPTGNIVGYGRPKTLPFTLNMLFLNYLIRQYVIGAGYGVARATIVWKGRTKPIQVPSSFDSPYWSNPYWLPEQNRKGRWVICTQESQTIIVPLETDRQEPTFF